MHSVHVATVTEKDEKRAEEKGKREEEGDKKGKKGPREGADAKLTFDRLMLLSTHSAAKLRILDSGVGLSAQTRRISAEIFPVHLSLPPPSPPAAPRQPRPPQPQPPLPL